jgi:hypothetical protein
MLLKAPMSSAAVTRGGPPAGRRWWIQRLAPLVVLGMVVGLGHAAAAGIVVREAVVRAQGAADEPGRGGGTSKEVSQARQAAVSSVLEGMNAALAKRDQAAFLGVVDPADVQLRARQAAAFTALGRLPLAQVRYDWDGVADTSDASVAKRYADPQAVVAVVQRRTWLKGWDRTPTVESIALSFARRNGKWLLVGDTDGRAALPAQNLPEPWTLGDVAVIERDHVLVIGERTGGAEHQRALRRLADKVEDAASGVRSMWRSDSWNGKVVVYAMTAKPFLNPWFGRRASDGRVGDGGDAAEFDAEVVPMAAATMDGSPTTEKFAGTRMVVAPAVLSYSNSEARAVIRHELTHMATFGRAEAPAWVSEGAAEYTAYRSISGSASVDGVEALDDRGLPLPMWAELKRSSYEPVLEIEHDVFYAGSAREVGEKYADAWFAALYIADTYGESTLRRFMARASDPAQPTIAAREKVALAEVLDTDRESFQQAVSTYARDLRQNFV